MNKYVFLAFAVLILVGCASACLAGAFYEEPAEDLSGDGYSSGGIGFGIGIFIGFAIGYSIKDKDKKGDF